ncbi:MAG: MEDS domain-containing protein [Solirubrobacteraceae bacterium]
MVPALGPHRPKWVKSPLTHRRAFTAELETVGVDVAKTGREGTLVMRDATATMATFMPGGRIDRDAFRQVVGGILRQAGASGKPLRVHGEMVALLWEDGHVPAAIEVEELWNELAREVEFSLVCAYRRRAERRASSCGCRAATLRPPGLAGRRRSARHLGAGHPDRRTLPASRAA